MRTGFDTDPSAYMGRFLPEGLSELDESSGMALACSKHISWQFIEGGGVQTTNVLHTSINTRAQLGAVGIGDGAVGVEQAHAVRVSYTLTGKMVSTIDDPAAFAECCKSQPDQCTNRMVGEFLQGTGSVDVEVARGRHLGVEVRPLGSPVAGGVHVSDGVAWRRAVVFPEPVYFAFKATPTPYEQAAVRTCSDWVDVLPESPEGLYLRASSGPAWSEQSARAKARKGLSEQALAVAGIAHVSKAVVPGVHEQDWCMERYTEEGQTWYAAHVLGFMDDDARAEARAEVYAEAQAPKKAITVPVLARPEATAPSAPACADWTETVPASGDGLFVVGRHALPAVTKQGARLKARANAHLQAGLATGLGALALANGTSIGVQERDWCIVPMQIGGGRLYQASMLGFVSEAEQARLRALPQPAAPLVVASPAQALRAASEPVR
ncbi:MAG TPA: hypothetical protein DFR83_12025 [Deltaproteobacteria bacterium]|nr:hypothetical protein [Deltaproteobacteria bacterium]